MMVVFAQALKLAMVMSMDSSQRSRKSLLREEELNASGGVLAQGP